MASTQATQLILAFIDALDGKHVTFAQRNGSRGGYLHVVLPGFDLAKYAQRHLVIELTNGSVGVTEALHGLLGTRKRPLQRIGEDPLGYSAGPNFGRFEYGLTFAEIEAGAGGVSGFVTRVCEALQKLTTSTDADAGDYK